MYVPVGDVIDSPSVLLWIFAAIVLSVDRLEFAGILPDVRLLKEHSVLLCDG